MLYSNHAVLADTMPTNTHTTPTGQTAQADSKVADHQGSEGTAAPAASTTADQEKKVATTAPAASTTADQEKKVATTAEEKDKDKQTNASETPQKPTNVGKKDTEVTSTNDAKPATQKTTAKSKVRVRAARLRSVMKVAKAAPIAETPDPTTPSDSTSMAIVNDKNKLDKNWIQLDNGKAQIYFTVKGNDQKPYVTSFMDKDVKSTLYTKRFDPNSLELNIEYQNGDKDAGPGLVLVWDDKYLQLNTSRIGAEDLVYTTNSGVKDYVPVSPGNGFYKSYNEWLKEKQDPSKLHLISLWQKVPANSTFTATLPFKYVGNADVVKSTRVDAYLKPYSTTLTFDPFELHPEQIDPAPKPTTDDATTTTGVYNNPLVTSSDWIKMVHGNAIGYYTAKGKDGKTYVTGYAAPKGNSQSIFNVDQIDLNSLEFHLLYHNGDKEVKSGLWFNFADNKAIAIDTSRLGADGPQLKSQQGWSYKWAIHTGSDGGTYYNSWAEYLKAHNNVGDQASEISMTGVAIKPDDTIEFNIPVKYTGQLSARTPSLTFSPHINDYGKGFTQNWADLYFTTVKKDLSEVKRVVLLPTEFMGEKPGESDWKLVKEISKDMPNGWDAFKISNFPTYKGSFNMDSLPIGDKPSLVYGSAQYFIDLSKIQEIFANHGYTVKYANNNGKAQEMPFYAYSTIPLAKRVDDDKPFNNDPSIWVIQVQAVPAIILNKDQHYVADPNAKPWDTTSMIDEIYAADDAGQRKTRDQLGKLPKTDVDISYEYQAPGAATAAAVDKVDLTKAGVYTVTYSHTYADGRVVKDSRKVYVDGVKPENKKITRTIIVHEPNGTDQTVSQTATVTRKVILDATTGKIKSAGKWSTAKWEAYSAPEFKGYTPAPAQIDETTVNEGTQDTTVEISYTANKTPEQPDHNVDGGKQEHKYITRTIIVHTPNGTDQKVIQKATLTREVILDATTGEIKSAGKWSTAKWETYLAPEFKGYTPAPAQIDETTVNEGTQDTTVEISYTANKTPEQPDHNVDGGKQETKYITRTIIVHTPNGTDQTVIQKATLTRKVILDATTGEIKSAGKWSTAKWETYSAPEFKGYTPAPAQIDETTVNEDTQDTTVEISYTANKTPEQPDHNVDGGKQETKYITRTIIVHEPNGTDQTVIQTATVTRKVILDATTGEIKSAGKWSTAKWEAYSAPEFKGYTPAPAQIDETTVNEDTQDTTVEISYTANKTPEQPDHNGKQETKDITRTIIVHEPNGTDQTVIQKATLTRKVILDATTGEIKSAGKWSTAKWERYSAPEFKGYTPAPAQIEETTVNEDTQDTTVEISYTANKTPEQPDHNGKQETKDITRTIMSTRQTELTKKLSKKQQ
ncbi:putative mucus binding protein [Lactobacillus johnsonii FI9785]|uniref:Mucus binding protein n=2 Tax=Lactobacillus johnsonii TaxID=33959 RepID=D0R5H6_LACJF|nr:putative mucus binding protein [Lactobacillus johnsonii FI9785]